MTQSGHPGDRGFRMPAISAERRVNDNGAAHRMRYGELIRESNCPLSQLMQ
jgi:hypothetical protein